MIRKIILSFFLLSLFIAIPLATAGVTHVEIGPAMIGFLRQTSKDLSYWKINLPEIPHIPEIVFSTPKYAFTEVLISIFNAIMNFFNIIITILNVWVDIINSLITFIQYVLTLLKNLIAFTDTLKRIGSYA